MYLDETFGTVVLLLGPVHVQIGSAGEGICVRQLLVSDLGLRVVFEADKGERQPLRLVLLHENRNHFSQAFAHG
jgi:hypothetical protein